MKTIILLFISNVFMTLAWYGHLKFKGQALWLMITAAQLKLIQEVITLLVFGVFAITYVGEKLAWNHAAAFLCLCAAVFFTFGFSAKPSSELDSTVVQSHETIR